MKRKKIIEKILVNHFKKWTIKVEDMSSLHRGHNDFDGNGETHFTIQLQPNIKHSFNRISIHRKINKLLKKQFSNGLHALEIKIKN